LRPKKQKATPKAESGAGSGAFRRATSSFFFLGGGAFEHPPPLGFESKYGRPKSFQYFRHCPDSLYSARAMFWKKKI